MYIQITDWAEIEAAERGEIKADFYRDGEVYAERASLAAWLTAHTAKLNTGIVESTPEEIAAPAPSGSIPTLTDAVTP